MFQSSSSSPFTRLSPPSQAAASHGSFNVDEGVSESTLTEANVASVLHQILREQRDGLYQQGHKMAVKCLEQISFTCFSQEVKQMVYFSYLHFFDSRQQNDSVSLRLPAQLLLSGQWKWLGPPVQQQQLRARPWRLFWGGRAGPTVPVRPVSPGSTEPHLPGEPELVPPSTTGLVLRHSSLFDTNLKHRKQDDHFEGWDWWEPPFCLVLILLLWWRNAPRAALIGSWRYPEVVSSVSLSGPTLRRGPDVVRICFQSDIISFLYSWLISSQNLFCGIIHPHFAQRRRHKHIKMSLKQFSHKLIPLYK